MRWLPALCVVVTTTIACGRIAFDPLDNADDATTTAPRPLVWLTMDDAGSTVLADSSGHAHDATSGAGTSAPSATPGIHAMAALFDGDDHASIAYAPDLDIATLTIAVWVKLDAQPTDYSQIVSRQFSTEEDDTWILGYRGLNKPSGTGAPYQSALRTTISTAAESDLIGVPSTPDLGVWVHIATTYDGATLRLYRNGIEMTSRSLSGDVEPQPTRIMIGAADNGATLLNEHLSGAIDDLRIYATALSAADIAALATP